MASRNPPKPCVGGKAQDEEKRKSRSLVFLTLSLSEGCERDSIKSDDALIVEIARDAKAVAIAAMSEPVANAKARGKAHFIYADSGCHRPHADPFTI